MKKVFKYFVLFMIIVFPLQTKALTGSINISCDKENYELSDTATCKVTGTSQDEVYSVSANIEEPNWLDMEFKVDDSWQGSGDDGKIMLYTDKGKTGTFNIGTITLKAKESVVKEEASFFETLFLNDCKFWDTNGKAWDVEYNTIQVNYNINLDSNTTDNKNNTTNNSSDSTKMNNNSTKTSDSVANPKTGEWGIRIIILILAAATTILGIFYKRSKKIFFK